MNTSMVLYQQLFLAGISPRDHHWYVCKGVALSLHFLILCTFFWTNVMAWDLFQTFGQKEFANYIRGGTFPIFQLSGVHNIASTTMAKIAMILILKALVLKQSNFSYNSFFFCYSFIHSNINHRFNLHISFLSSGHGWVGLWSVTLQHFTMLSCNMR